MVSEEIHYSATSCPWTRKIFHPELAEEILENFKMLVPFYKYFAGLCASVTQGQQREEI